MISIDFIIIVERDILCVFWVEVKTVMMPVPLDAWRGVAGDVQSAAVGLMCKWSV